MFQGFLLPETVVQEDGAGPELSIDPALGRPLRLTLGITRILEQQSLELSIWGSPDQANWGSLPLLAFPQKFYCGVYQMLLDLSAQPEIRHLQARWKVARWGHSTHKPLFGLYVFAEETDARALARSA